MVAAFAVTVAVPATALFFALTYTDPVADAIAFAVAGLGVLVLTVLQVFRPTPDVRRSS
jgi:hypothetical protein